MLLRSTIFLAGLLSLMQLPGIVLADAPGIASIDAATETAQAAPWPVTEVAPATPVESRPTAVAAPPQSARIQNLPHNLSPWGMFMAADWVVKSVMIGLALASLVTWTIWLAKSIELARARRAVQGSLALLNDAHSLPEILLQTATANDTTSLLARAAQAELELSADTADRSGIRQRVDSRMERIVAAAGRRVNRGTGPLATIGSTAPFVGLFGTVWGIMNSFIGISQAQTTNLAVVAPGIAEALLATALGLVAAIPAVVIYNQFSRTTASYRASLGDAAAAIARVVSRDLDRDHPVRPARRKVID